MATQFRYRVPPVSEFAVARPRLLSVMRERFDRRLTVIAGGAGSGKSTLLAQAIDENRMDPLGTDVWLRVEAGDRDPRNLLSGLAAALGADTTTVATLEDVAGYVWARAPESVALVIDDSHRLAGAADVWAALAELLDALPRNGSMVVAGRTRPALPVARLAEEGQAAVIDETTLCFDADELQAFATARALPAALAAELPHWPALAVLSAVAGRAAPAAFLWEEILSTLPAERVEALASLIELGELDDDLVRAATGERWTMHDLLHDLPLVELVDAADGRPPVAQPHALWQQALARKAESGTRSGALRAGAEILLRRGEFGRAAAAYLLVGDRAGYGAVVREFATRPITALRLIDVRALQRALPGEYADAPEALYLAGVSRWGSPDDETVRCFQRAAALALAEGDPDLAAHASWRQAQLQHLDARFDPAVLVVVEEAARSGSRFAAAVAAFVQSIAAQHEGRPGDAVAAMERLAASNGFDDTSRTAALANRFTALGWPERVPVTPGSAFESGAFDIFGAEALWLRGELAPEAAASIVPEVRRFAERKGTTTELAATFSILALACLTVGDVGAARELVDAAQRRVAGMARQVVVFVLVADAIVVMAEAGEEAAADCLRRALDVLPVDRWIARPYLHVLAALYYLVPETRDPLDRSEVGPALTCALDGGRALVALDAGDRRPAAELPWNQLDLLRVHLRPVLLARLAAAAVVAGRPDADAALGLISDRALLRSVATRSPRPERELLEERIRVLPARPSFDLYVRTFGELEVTRSDGRPLPDAWARRARVRQLFAYLVANRTATRDAVVEELWPDVDAEKAQGNLRVNLAHLRTVLEPNRVSGDMPWFVQADGDRLFLADEGVRIDSDELEHHMRDAVRAEGDGLPSEALGHYTEACRLVRGEYLPLMLDGDVGAVDRIRFGSLARTAHCRRGELLLARGLPEEAGAAAAEAIRLDPLSEPAGRLFINCQIALDSRSAARQAAERLLATLADAGLTPDADTRRLVDTVRERSPGTGTGVAR